MAVANIAWILALSGERVLVVDWDLEAPGIHRYFHPFLDDKQLLTTKGLLDFVEQSAGQSAVASTPLTDEEVDVAEYITMLKWPATSSLNWERFGPRAGIDLLVAGCQGPAYSRRLNAFNWIDYYEKLGGRRLLDIARRELKGIYDYILIDSRTGVSDTSGICTVEMPDTLVVCFTLNDQSIMGASGVAESVLAQRQARSSAQSAPADARRASNLSSANETLRIFPVPTRVEIVSERSKREVALAFAQQKFGRCLNHLTADARDRYWGRVQLAYFPFYAFEEIPAVFGDPANEELSLSTPLKQIARFITDDESLDLSMLADTSVESERLRKEILRWYLRTAESSSLDALALAQTVYEQLDQDRQASMRKAMLRLIRVAVGRAPTAAPCAISNFETASRDILLALASAGIVLVDDNNASFADKDIPERWDLLRQWAKEDEAFLLWRQDFMLSANSWSRAKRDASGLLRGRFLDEAIAWFERRPEDLNELERDFITASQKARDREGGGFALTIPGTTLRIEIQPKLLIAGVPILILAFTAVREWSSLEARARADRQAKAAAIVTLASEQAERDPLTAALLLTEVPDFSADEDARRLALKLAAAELPVRIIRNVDAGWVDYARDGKMIVTSGARGAELWDAGTGSKIRELSNSSTVAMKRPEAGRDWRYRQVSHGAYVVPTSRAMKSAVFNGWVPDRAKLRGRSGAVDRIVTTAADGRVQVWGLDGKPLMTVAPEETFSSSPRCADKLMRLTNQNARRRKTLIGQQTRTAARSLLDVPLTARFSPDEVVVVIAYPNALVMADATTGKCFDIYDMQDGSFGAFSVDGELVLVKGAPNTAGSTNNVSLFRVQDWKAETYDSVLSPIAVAPNRKILTAAGTLLDVDLKKERNLTGGVVRFGSFSANSKYVAWVSTDSGWSPVDGSTGISKLQGPAPISMTLSPDGRYLVTGSADTILRIYDTARTPPSPISSWSELVAYIRRETKVCLAADQRSKLLNESTDIANQNALRCETQYK
jgi:WD40 repeat protein/cellulose biosynthesis protein BcsQ